MAAVDIKKNCNECFDSIQKKREEKKKGNNPVPYKPRHCHCEQLNPEEGLVCDCSGGKPYRRYKSSLKDQQDNKSVTDAIRSERKELDEKKSNDDLMKEVTKFRKKVRMEKKKKNQLKVNLQKPQKLMLEVQKELLLLVQAICLWLNF